jgi:hypothetical protein
MNFYGNTKVFVKFIVLILGITPTYLCHAQGDSAPSQYPRLQLDLNYMNRFAVLSSGSPYLDANNTVAASAVDYPVPFVDMYDQLKGSGLNLGLRLTNRKGNGICASASFRYDHIYFTKPMVDSNTRFVQGLNVQGLITDYHLSVYHVYDHGKVKHRAELGYSWMNRGTTCPISHYSISGTQTYKYVSLQDFTFEAIQLSYACMISNFNTSVSGYLLTSSSISDMYDGLKANAILEFKLGYSFNLLKD